MKRSYSIPQLWWSNVFYIRSWIVLFMKVELIRGTSQPERLVTRCARGDYRKDGVGQSSSYEEIMEPIEAKDRWLDRSDTELEAKKRSMVERFFKKRHMGPFEHPSATFAVEGVSRSCMAQLTRHRHATFDVQSMRYVDFSDFDLGVDEVEDMELDVLENMLSEHVVVPDEVVEQGGLRDYAETVVQQFERYESMVNSGVPKEDARMVLPLGTKVNLTFSMNARAIMHLLDMRMKANAQWEIRELSDKVLEGVKDWMPTTFEIYEDEHPNRLQA